MGSDLISATEYYFKCIWQVSIHLGSVLSRLLKSMSRKKKNAIGWWSGQLPTAIPNAVGEDTHDLRLTNELVDLRSGYANPAPCYARRCGENPLFPCQNEKKHRFCGASFCIEATKKIFLSFLNKVSNSHGVWDQREDREHSHRQIGIWLFLFIFK